MSKTKWVIKMHMDLTEGIGDVYYVKTLQDYYEVSSYTEFAAKFDTEQEAKDRIELEALSLLFTNVRPVLVIIVSEEEKNG